MGKQFMLRGLVALSTALAMLVASAGAAQAAGATDNSSPAATGIQELLRQYPGATVVSPDTIKIAPGVLLSLPAPITEDSATTAAITPQSSWLGCTYLYLCLFSGTSYTGYKLSLYDCDQGYDLSTIAYPSGGYWNDKTSSYVNNQSNGTYSEFYNWNGVNAWILLDTSVAQEASPYFSWDNTLDKVFACWS